MADRNGLPRVTAFAPTLVIQPCIIVSAWDILLPGAHSCILSELGSSSHGHGSGYTAVSDWAADEEDDNANSEHLQKIQAESKCSTRPRALHPRIIYAGRGKNAGFGASDTEEVLSNFSLWWMVSEIWKSQCHIRFEETALWNIPITSVERVPMKREVSDSA